MGTNYYGRYMLCEHCKRYDEFHIGKYSYGWKFGFEAHPKLGINSFKELNEFVKKNNVVIYDEYEDNITWEELCKTIKQTMKAKGDHANEYPAHSYHDAEGYVFSVGDFS